MDIKDIVKMYGKVDYYEMQTGRIYHLSQMSYHLFDNTTRIPVSENGRIIGEIKLEGNYETMA